MTKIDELLSHLQHGVALTPNEIKLFGIKRPHSMIYRLRQEGYAIYSNRWYDINGKYCGVFYKAAPNIFGSNRSRYGQHILNGRRKAAIKSLYIRPAKTRAKQAKSMVGNQRGYRSANG